MEPAVHGLLLYWVRNLAGIEVTDPEFRPVSSWYAKRYPREKEGVLAKAVRLASKVRVVRRAYEVVEAEVPSESEPGRVYRVKVYLYPAFDFECTCPHSQYRFNPCKHVLATVLALLAEPIAGDPEGFYAETLIGRSLASAVHRALCVHAYLKARSLSPRA